LYFEENNSEDDVISGKLLLKKKRGRKPKLFSPIEKSNSILFFKVLKKRGRKSKGEMMELQKRMKYD
jgi:hypothetical protein